MFDDQTFESLAELICGDTEKAPQYRSGWELTKFFKRAGAGRFVHTNETRKWWTKDSLMAATSEELTNIIKRFVSPKEYGGDQEKVNKALLAVNEILQIEGYKVILKGIDPVIEKTEIDFDIKDEKQKEELKPLPPPDFLTLQVEPGIGEILKQRWNETQLCVDSKAYLAALVMMGSLLEGLILATMQRFPQVANQSKVAPVDPKTQKVKSFPYWTLSQMIDVAHDLKWIGLDVQKFSHALRDFRNLIHPYEQNLCKTFPDEDTCKISWLVVQAAVNDLALILK
jgi:hypothetical protein